MAQFDIANLLPMLPWEGPPLPRFLGITWQSLQGGQQLGTPSTPSLPPFGQYYNDEEEEEETSVVPYQEPVASYSNEESWEISWDEETGLPLKVVVHREAVRR